MSTPESPNESSTTTAADRPLPCRQCRYNLAGLAESGDCPECGTPIGQSLAILLSRADTRYRASIKAGAKHARLFVWLLLGYILVLIIGLMAYAIAQAVGSPRVAAQLEALVEDPPIAYTIVTTVIGLGYMVLFVLGWWNLSARLADRPEHDQPRRRGMLRIAMVVYIAFYLVALPFSLATSTQMAPSAMLIAAVPSLASSVAYIVLLFAFGPLVESLALRIPDEDTARTARSFHRFMRAAIISALIAVPLGMIGGLLAPVAGFGALPLVLLGVVVFAILGIVAIARYCSMCLRLHKSLRDLD